MQVPGDADGCRAAARELLRAAAAVRDAVPSAPAPAPVLGLHWSGAAAGALLHRTGLESALVDHTVVRLHQAGRRLGRFADDLEVLQSRSGVLAADAAHAGMHLDSCGWIPPVPAGGAALVPVGAEQVRGELMARARALRVDEGELHDALLRDLRALHDPLSDAPWKPSPRCGPDDAGVDWSPAAADAPALGLAATDALGRLPVVPGVLGAAAAHPVAGGVVTLGTELALGKEWDDAAIKAGLTTGVTAGAVLAAGALVGAAPVVLSGAVLVAVGAGVSYAAGRVFDAHGHHLPFVDAPSKRRRRCRR